MARLRVYPGWASVVKPASRPLVFEGVSESVSEFEFVFEGGWR